MKTESMRTLGRTLSGKELAEIVGDFVNFHELRDFEEFAEAMEREHRTLQQKAFGLFLCMIKRWAAAFHATPGVRFDARNEWTVQKCSEIVEALGKYNLRPPLI